MSKPSIVARSAGRLPIALKLPIIIAMLTGFAVLCTATVAQRYAADGLADAAKRTLAAVNRSNKTALDAYFSRISSDLITASAGTAIRQALDDFKMGWSALDRPSSTLRSLFIDDNPYPAPERQRLDFPGDNSPYSMAHREHHPSFRKFLKERGYSDLLLFDRDGNLIYTVAKERPFAANLLAGSRTAMGLTEAFLAAKDMAQADHPVFVDFRPDEANDGAPAAYIAAPVLNGRKGLEGVLAFKLSTAGINAILSAGATGGGESYLVGRDGLMRSDARRSEGPTALRQRIASDAVRHAFDGGSGVAERANFRGVRVASAVLPISFNGVRYAVVSEQPVTEFLAASRAMTTAMAVVGAIILFAATAIGLAVGRGIGGPVKRMTHALSRLARHDTTVEISDAARADEIGAMSRAALALRGEAATAFKLGRVVAQMPIGVMTCDPRHFTIDYTNMAAHELLRQFDGVSPAGMDDAAARPIGTLHRDLADTHRLLADPEKLPHDILLTLGEETLVVKISALRDRDGGYAGPMMTWQNITERVSLASTFEESVMKVVAGVSDAASQMESTAKAMSHTVDGTNQKAGAVATAVERAAANVQTVAAAAERLANSVAEINRQVNQSTAVATRANDEAVRTNETVRSLAAAAQHVGEIVDLISNVAEQTNLLALNATIEAARAGEAGKGFAVVAAEVKTLANQTAKATGDIAEQIDEMQLATDGAVAAIRNIGATIGEINEIAAVIANAIAEQGAATQEIAKNVQQASAGTQEVSLNISSVTVAAAETGEAARQVLEAASALSQQSDTLADQVQRFLIDVRGL